MRWAPQVCPQCAGALYADYAEVALVCLSCGRIERAPTAPRDRRGSTRLRREAPDSPVPSRSTCRTRTIGLVEVRAESLILIEDTCAGQRYRLVPLTGGGRPITGRRPPAVDLLVVEADRAGRAVKVAADLRRRFPAAPVAIILTYWSEAERDATAAAEFVLHAPLRRAEVAQVMQVMENYGGWLPAPLLASKYRASLAS